MFTLFLLSMVVVGVVINLSGLSALNFTPADRAALAQSTANAFTPSPPPPPPPPMTMAPRVVASGATATTSGVAPPPPPPKKVIPLQAVSQAIIGQQSHPLTQAQIDAGHAATLAREAVYQANGVSGEARLTGSVDPSIVAAADNAAAQANIHVAAAQASGQDSVSLDIDHVTGQVGIAALEDKVAALPMPVKIGAAILTVFGLGKLLSRKK